MTRDEQIDKARWAMLTAKCKCGQAGEGGACSRCEAEAALDAADVEGMVRLGAQMARDFHAESIDAIVQSVMEGGQ